MPDLLLGLTHYFLFYNEERLHQSLGYTTPDVVYQTGTGGAMITPGNGLIVLHDNLLVLFDSTLKSSEDIEIRLGVLFRATRGKRTRYQSAFLRTLRGRTQEHRRRPQQTAHRETSRQTPPAHRPTQGKKQGHRSTLRHRTVAGRIRQKGGRLALDNLLKKSRANCSCFDRALLSATEGLRTNGSQYVTTVFLGLRLSKNG